MLNKQSLNKLELDALLNCLPENIPIYKDSGLWNIYDGDQFKNELYHQGLNEPLKEFIIRSILGMMNSEEVETDSLKIDLALAYVTFVEKNKH